MVNEMPFVRDPKLRTNFTDLIFEVLMLVNLTYQNTSFLFN